ncbi:hypothetical protein CPC08DRAFT_343416, partial [Agrocybe pediades]
PPPPPYPPPPPSPPSTPSPPSPPPPLAGYLRHPPATSTSTAAIHHPSRFATAGTAIHHALVAAASTSTTQPTSSTCIPPSHRASASTVPTSTSINRTPANATIQPRHHDDTHGRQRRAAPPSSSATSTTLLTTTNGDKHRRPCDWTTTPRREAEVMERVETRSRSGRAWHGGGGEVMKSRGPGGEQGPRVEETRGRVGR